MLLEQADCHPGADISMRCARRQIQLACHVRQLALAAIGREGTENQ
jgi:hypothetical protein